MIAGESSLWCRVIKGERWLISPFFLRPIRCRMTRWNHCRPGDRGDNGLQLGPQQLSTYLTNSPPLQRQRVEADIASLVVPTPATRGRQRAVVTPVTWLVVKASP